MNTSIQVFSRTDFVSYIDVGLMPLHCLTLPSPPPLARPWDNGLGTKLHLYSAIAECRCSSLPLSRWYMDYRVSLCLASIICPTMALTAGTSSKQAWYIRGSVMVGIQYNPSPLLKEESHEIFQLRFSFQPTPSMPLLGIGLISFDFKDDEFF